MRSLLAVVIAAMAVGGLVPVQPVQAQQPARAGLLESTYGVEVTIPMAALEERYDAAAQQLPTGGTVPVDTCGNGRFVRNETAGWVRFRESQYENGCGEVRYAVDIPQGARLASVSFRADRAIMQPSTVTLTIDMQQELRVYDAQGANVAAFPYFEPSAPQHLEAEAFSYPIELEQLQGSLTLGWMFRDRAQTVGQPLVNPLAGQALSGTLQDARVTFDGIEMIPDRIDQERLGLQGESVRYATTVAVRVPDTVGVSGRIAVTLRVANELTFSHGLDPRGQTVPAEFMQVTENGDVTTVVLTGDATSSRGAGLYQLVFTSASPISPSPLLYPFIALVMAVPAGAGLLAWRNTRRFRLQSTPEFHATAANLENAVLAMLAVYLLLPLGVLVSGRLSLLASWPLEGEAGLVYLLIGIAFVAFLAVGFVGRRHLNHVMLEEAALKEQARRELERSNRELAEFAYVASHDLQEPLRTVASYTQLLQRRYKGKLDSDADEFIDSAVEGAQRMQHLIQDLLQYSRVGSKPESPGPVDLGAVVETVRRTLHQSLTEAGAQLVAAGLPTVIGNERQFEQLLQNLVANAVKFRDPSRPSRVEVAAEPIPGGWRVSVHDNVIGIDPLHFY
ncbi:MAG: sensor histidine kinase, partial [Thermoplasmatota archaeon]